MCSSGLAAQAVQQRCVQPHTPLVMPPVMRGLLVVGAAVGGEPACAAAVHGVAGAARMRGCGGGRGATAPTATAPWQLSTSASGTHERRVEAQCGCVDGGAAQGRPTS